MKFNVKEIKNIPSIPGIYYFYEGEKLMYIGKTTNLKRRITQHKLNHNWATIHNNSQLIDIIFARITEIKIIFIDKTLISIIERLEIRKLKPVLNHETYGEDSIFDEIKQHQENLLQKVLDMI